MKRHISLVATTLMLALLGNSPLANAATPAASDTAGRNTAFAADLYTQLNKTNADQNLFLSPYSISAALGMTAQGAKGKTADQMNKVLNIGGDFQAGMAEITQALNPKNAPFELSVANALWVDQTFPLAAGFVADAKKNYDAGVIGVDFIRNAEPARQQINNAIAAQTHDKIKDLIPNGAVNSNTRLVLTNAIYFKGTWQTPFPKEATTEQPFHAAGGMDVKVPMMKSSESAMYTYGETNDAQILSLPYKGAAAAPAGGRAARGGAPAGPSTLSMLIILPKKVDGLADIEKQATAANLTKWATGLRRQTVQVFLPRFTMTTKFKLSKELQALGMTDAFTDAADFSGICASASNKLAITAVLHKAFVEVNEEGTEAAAATGVIVGITAMPTRPIEFRADYPFLFMIRHEPTGSILFMGHLANPKP